MTENITPAQFHESNGVEDWRVVGDGANAFFPTDSFAESAQLVQAIGDLPSVDEHRPDLDIRAAGVTVRLITYTDHHYGMSMSDVEVARDISSVAQKLGLTADPSGIQSVLVVPGAPQIKEIIPFWKAALGYVPRRDSPEEDLVDPHDRGPGFWFEEMEEPRADGGGTIHLAVWVPYEQAQARVDAALAAGGRMVRDQFAPAWWTLADSAGNEVDIATAAGRQ